MKMESMYEQLGVSAAVYEYGERIIAELRIEPPRPRPEDFSVSQAFFDYKREILSYLPVTTRDAQGSIPRA